MWHREDLMWIVRINIFEMHSKGKDQWEINECKKWRDSSEVAV